SIEIVMKVKYRLEFEEYPETSEDSVACIYNVTGMDSNKALKIFDLKNIQYSYKEGTTCKSIYCSFLKTKIYKEIRTCHSIKMCQFAAPELATMTHTTVTFDDNLFKKIHKDNTSDPTYFIGCEKFKNDECGHQYQSLSGQININYLKRLFQEYIYYNNGITGEISNSVRHCYLVHPFMTQRLIQKKLECPVKFWHYVPENLEECPYIIIMSCYTYNYPLSLLSKIPIAIQNDLRNIIANENILDLTTRKLITCTSIQKFLKGVPLPELYPSLNNRSKIDYMIATKRHTEHLYTYVEKYQKTLLFAHAFTILQKTNAYKKLFDELFICVEQDCEHPIEFQSIYEHGIGYILADEYQSQALDWVQDKRQTWILASLSPAFTKMLPEIWTNTPFTMNAGESAHANINQNSYELSLLAAIQKVSEFDQFQWTISHEPSEMIAISRESSEMSIDNHKEILRIKHEKLNIQRDKNNELKREIIL
ncbi:12775_t:CDS:10, partial [Gigaspora margarita]